MGNFFEDLISNPLDAVLVVVGAVAGALTGGAGFIFTSALAGGLWGAGIGLGLTLGMKAIVPELPETASQSIANSPTYQNDLVVNTIKEGIPIALAYGYAELGGNIVRANDNNAADLRMVIIHGKGVASEALAYTINGEPFASIEGTQTKTFYQGTTEQLHDDRFSGVSSAFRGLTYTAFTFTKNNQVSYEPRVTVFGKWRCCENTSGVSVWTNNPGTIMYDWYKNIEGYNADQLDIGYFQDLETYCQPAVPLSGNTSPLRPALDSSTVKATNYLNNDYLPLYGVDKSASKVGVNTKAAWLSTISNVRIQFDFGQPVIIDKLVLENHHSSGGFTDSGIQNFDVRASNDPAAFADTLANPSNWETTIFNNGGASYVAAQHTAADVEDPQEFTWDNSTPYRYWAMQCKDNYNGNYLGFRDVEFQGHLPHRYTFDYVFDAKMTKNDAKKLIWKSFNGAVIESQGKLKPIWESAKDVSYNFTLDNIVKDSFVWGKIQRPNIIRVHYKDIYDGNTKTFVELKDEESINEKGEILFEESLYFINNATVARRRVQFLHDKFSTLDYTCKFTAFPGSQGVEPLDRVTVSHSLPGWTNKDFIVKTKQEDAIGQCTFECEAYFDGLYLGEEAQPQTSYNSNTRSLFKPPDQVTSLVLADVSTWASDGYYKPKINATYNKPNNAFGWTHTNIYVSNDDATYYLYGTDNSGGTGYIIDTSTMGIESGSTAFIKVLSVNLQGIVALDNGNAVTGALKILLPDLVDTITNVNADGATFVFPKGKYYADSAVTVPDYSMTVKGADRGDTIFVNNEGSPLFYMNELTKITNFDAFSVSSQNTSAAKVGPLFYAYGNLTNPQNTVIIGNIDFYGNNDDLLTAGDTAINAIRTNYLLIGGCKFYNFTYAVNSQGVYDEWVMNNSIKHATIGIRHTTYLTNDSNTVFIYGNKIKDCISQSINVNSNTGNTTVNNNSIITLTGTTINEYHIGIIASFYNGQMNGNSVLCETLRNDVHFTGISLSAGANSSISKNKIQCNITSNSGVSAIQVGASKCDISENIIKIDNDNNTDYHIGIYTNNDSNKISANKIDMVNSDTNDFGIYLDATAENNQVEGNDFLNILDYNQVYDDGAQNISSLNTTDGLNMSTIHGQFTNRYLS